MSQNGLYSANGRISKAALFDTTSHVLERGHDTAKKLQPVVDNNIEIISGLQAFHRYATFYVFYMIADETTSPGPYYYDAIRTWFIPVNDRLPGLYIPTRWIQDPFLITPGQILFYDNDVIKATLAEYVCTYLDLADICMMPKARELPGSPPVEKIEGGDLLIGSSAGERFVLHSIKGLDNDTALRKELASKYKIDIDKYSRYFQYVGNQLTEEFNLYYHLDYFLTLVGPLKSQYDCSPNPVPPKTQLMLVAKPYVFSINGVDSTRGYEPPRPYTILNPDEDILVDFDYIALPMILMKKRPKEPLKKDNIKFVLSYNNCLVENYDPLTYSEDTGEPVKKGNPCRRTINIYFPDYRTTLWEFIQEVYEDPGLKKSLHQLLQQDINSEGQLYYNHSVTGSELWDSRQAARNDLNAFLNRVHNYIRSQLAAKGIYNVHFIRQNFSELAESWGSLHCLVKVFSRDGVIE